MRSQPLLLPSASDQAVGTAGEWILPRVRRSMERAIPSVDAFVTGILIYVLSQLWYDLFSTYLLQLHPVPYCGSEATRPCCAEAEWRAHATFALQLLLSLGVVDRILAFLRFRSRRLESTFRARIYAPLAGMCVGWAFGSASVQYIRSLDDICAGCVWIKLLFAVLVTLLSSFAILVLQSLFDVLLLSLAVAVATLRSCEGHCISASLLAVARLLRQLEALLSSLMRLLTKALTTLVMILWNFALSKAVVVNLSSEDLERVGPRLWFLWSLSLTFGLSGVSVALARFRLSLERQQAASQIAREQRESTLSLPQGRSPVAQPSVCELLCRAVRRQCSGLNYRAELISLCAVLEATFGWVTGCAWTNYVGAIWSSLDECEYIPMPSVRCSNPFINPPPTSTPQSTYTPTHLQIHPFTPAEPHAQLYLLTPTPFPVNHIPNTSLHLSPTHTQRARQKEDGRKVCERCGGVRQTMSMLMINNRDRWGGGKHADFDAPWHRPHRARLLLRSARLALCDVASSQLARVVRREWQHISLLVKLIRCHSGEGARGILLHHHVDVLLCGVVLHHVHTRSDDPRRRAARHKRVVRQLLRRDHLDGVIRDSSNCSSAKAFDFLLANVRLRCHDACWRARGRGVET